MLFSHTIKLVRFYEGADGLKTGHTDAAKYCLAATAKRDDLRFIAIVLGEETSSVRNKEAMSLLDYGFDNYKINVIKKKDDVIDKIKLDKANKKTIEIVPINDIAILSKKSDNDKKYTYEVKLNDFKLPLKKGDIVGKLIVKSGKDKVKEEDLTISSNVNELSFFELYKKSLEDIIMGYISFS